MTDTIHTAEFRFETPESQKLFTVLSPESGSDPSEKSHVSVTVSAGAILLSIKAEDISALRASINMWLRLIAVSTEILAL